MKHFASDNYAGFHPEVLQALADANVGHAPAYGADPLTQRLSAVMREHFGADAETFPVFNGTGANVIALQAMLPRWGSVVCADTAHINVDEGAAPERVGGMKLLSVPTSSGKLSPGDIDRAAADLGNPHRGQPLAVSISQSTELGTTYTAAEITELVDTAHAHGMLFHVDGSRLGNAAAYLGTTMKALTTDAGVDVVSLGGTKNGLMGAEAVVTLREIPGVEFIRKHSMQLASKMRFLSAQLLALYEGDLWQRSATHANRMASRLAEGLGNRALYPVESNAVFATLDPEAVSRARETFQFYAWPGGPDQYRLMCSFDTTEQEVDALTALLT